MKKHLLLLTFFIGLLNYAMPSYADNNKILIDPVLKSETSGPRTPEPSIEAYIEDRVIIL